MLVILQKEQILSTQNICDRCLWATQSGKPRWHEGKLDCGYCIENADFPQKKLYECQMGFRLVNVD